MQDEIAILTTVYEITQLKARYCRCVDTKDWAGYAACLTDDTVLDGEGAVHTGRDAVVDFVSQALAEAVTVHHVHNPEIVVTGPDTATGIWAMNDYVDIPLPDGGSFVLRGYGHYHEEYARTCDGWRLKSSTLRRLRVDTEGDL
jgi:uncharacterized protein (TIGR02246 family)